jgi:hypothetical protein
VYRVVFQESGSVPTKTCGLKFCFIANNIDGFRYRAYGDPTVELPWSEVTAISNEVTQYVLKDLNPGDQFEIQVVAFSFKNIFFNFTNFVELRRFSVATELKFIWYRYFLLIIFLRDFA